MGDWLKTSIKAKRESWGNRGDYCTAATITRASKGKKERRGWGNSNLEVWRRAWKSWGSVQAYEERVVPGCSCSLELKEGTPWCWGSEFWEGGRLKSSKEGAHGAGTHASEGKGPAWLLLVPLRCAMRLTLMVEKKDGDGKQLLPIPIAATRAKSCCWDDASSMEQVASSSSLSVSF